MTLSADYFYIDINKPTPRYHQIQENLAELIEIGVLKLGEALPSERDLSDLYGVSRLTVRQAIDGLVVKGLLQKQQGVGTFVNGVKQVATLAPTVTGFSQRMHEAGLKHATRLLSREVVVPVPVVSHRLGLRMHERVVCLKRLRLVDDEPLLLETSYLPYERFPELMGFDLETQSLYHQLEAHYRVQIHETEQTLEPTLLTAEEATSFAQQPGVPAMLVQIVAYASHRVPVEFCKSIVRGDRCRHYFRIYSHRPIVDL